MKIFKSIKNSTINQYFAENANDFYKQLSMLGHNGVDWSANDGDQIRYDVDEPGTVVSLSLSPTAGFGITIDTEGYRHIYWHLKEIKVVVGQQVKLGNLIATADNTGIYTTGTHLHRGLYQTVKDINTGKAVVINADNGYGGAINPQPFHTGIYVVDYINQQIGIIQKMINILKQLLDLLR